MTTSKERIDRGTLLALLAMGLSILVLANDFTALSVALPAMEKDFDTDVATIQWVVNAYALVFGVLIVTGGRLADMFGRRRAFFAGAGIFALFSFLGGVAPTESWLIATRAVMGVGGALLWPAILGMVYAALPEDRAGLAGGLILGVAGLGNALGPMLGGVLTDELSWRWIFFLNVPVAAFAALITWRKVHQPFEREPGARVDYLGVATLSIALVSLLLALDQSSDYGWGDPRIVVLLAASVVLLAAFVRTERRAGADALVPRDVMRNASFTGACVAVLLMSATFFSSLVYLPQFFIKLLGDSPLEAGVGLLPFMAVFAAVSFLAGSLYERLGAKLIVALGAACIAIGPFLNSLVERDSGYEALVPGMIVLGIGVGLFYASVTTSAVTALDPSRASLAGGIVYMFQIAGGAIGLGLTTSVFSTASQDELREDVAAAGFRVTEEQRDAIEKVLTGTGSARSTLERFPAEASERLTEIARDAFVHGLQAGFRLNAALAAAGFVVAVLFVGGRLRPLSALRRRASRRAAAG